MRRCPLNVNDCGGSLRRAANHSEIQFGIRALAVSIRDSLSPSAVVCGAAWFGRPLLTPEPPLFCQILDQERIVPSDRPRGKGLQPVGVLSPRPSLSGEVRL